MRARHVAPAVFALTAASACNAIFGIEIGVGAGGATSTSTNHGSGGATSTSTITASNLGGGGSAGGTATSSASTSSSSTSSSSGTGGAPACPPSKDTPCHVDGGTGAICEPILMSGTYDGYALGVAVVGTTVYWAGGDGRVHLASDQGVLDPMSYGTGNDSVSVVVDDTRIYWTDYNDATIRAALLGANHASADVSTMIGDDAGPTPKARLGRIAERGGKLYWSAQSPAAIWTAPSDGTQVYATKVADKNDDSESTDRSIGVAVDDVHVYWTDANKVRRLPLDKLGDATAIENFATDFGGPGEVQVDGTRVYWTSGAGVSSKKKDGTNLITLPANTARSLLLDGPYVYWSEVGGSILRNLRAGDMTTVTVVAQGTPGSFMMAADCGARDWGTFTLGVYGKVYKIRKPD